MDVTCEGQETKKKKIRMDLGGSESDSVLLLLWVLI